MRDPGPGPKYVLPSTLGIENHDPTIKKEPGYSIGGRRTYKTQSGPGPYYVDGGIDRRGRINNNGFTLAGRPRQSFWEKNSQDQPTTKYDVNRSAVEPSSPRYSFGAPRRNTYKTDGPGPIYNVPSTFGTGPSATLFGRNTRQSFHFDYNKTPGPSYGFPQNSSRGFIIGQRTKLPGNQLVTPGPVYNPNYGSISPRAPGYSLGIRHHDEKVVPLTDVSD